MYVGMAENFFWKMLMCNLRFRSCLIFVVMLGLCGFAYAESFSSSGGGVGSVCELICKGQFDLADERIKAFDLQHKGLAQIVGEFQEIGQRRQSAKETAYIEQLAKLEGFRNPADFNTTDANVADANTLDPNDPNSIVDVLAVIAKVGEFSNQEQKTKLLADPFVIETMQKAVKRAVELETKGDWLKAYAVCYSWLQAIDEDNKSYSDYGEQLIEKANIAASFQDSPCETSKQRYKSVRKEMFVRALDALNFNYVKIIDYQKMSEKVINRCKLLGEVMVYEANDISFDIRESRYEAWVAGLSMILGEVNRSFAGISKDKFVKLFDEVLALNKSEEGGMGLPEGVLIVQFSEAALSSLDDYTVMVWPKQVEDFEKLMTNEFTGVGILISREKGQLTAASLLPDTPAYRSGLDAGDVIEKVDGVETKDMTLGCAVKRITGPAGTNVVLTIKRSGEEQSRDITITRAKITVQTVRGWQRTETGEWLHMVDQANKIGYIRITNFSDKTADDFEKVLRQLERQGMKGLIIDLRYNTGGLLSSAIKISDKFLEEGMIVSTRPRFGQWTYASAHKRKTHPNYPVAVLINRFSASASEIVSGALADKSHQRAILVGERTYGKGSVQGITGHPGKNAQLKYTMAYYHLPSGQRVESKDAMKALGRDDWGVGPHIEVKLRSDELIKLRDLQRDNDVLVKADHDNNNAPLKKRTIEETLAIDSQLEAGLLVIKTKLIQAEASAVHAAMN